MATFRFDKIRPYTQVATGFRFPVDPKRPYLIMYFSENSKLTDDYSKLGTRLMDVRFVVVPITTIPKTKFLPLMRDSFKNFGLRSYGTNMTFPDDKSIYYDLSFYLEAIDKIYKPINYRQRSGLLIKNMLMKSFMSFSSMYRKVFFYTIDSTKPIKKFQDRKIFPILQMIKDGDIFFDDMVFGIIGPSHTTYRLLVKDKDFIFARVFNFLRIVKPVDLETEVEDQADQASSIVIKNVMPEVTPEEAPKVKSAISSYLRKEPEHIDAIVSPEVSSEKKKEISTKVATSSILYNVSGDVKKATRVVNRIPFTRHVVAFRAISKAYKDEILEHKPADSISQDPIVQRSNPQLLVDKKTPDHLFQKRQIDFSTNLKKDLINVFRTLETKEIPIRLISLKIVDKPGRKGELDKSDISVIQVTMVDKFKNTHYIEMEMPKIDPKSGTFRVYGRRKCLINHIIQNPITFPKSYDSRFESVYSRFHITSKRTKKTHYLECYIASYRLPLLVVLAFSFGFDNTMRLYGLKYRIVDTKPKKGEFGTRINDSQSVIFEGANDDLKLELCQSFIQMKPFLYKIDFAFPSKEYFNGLILGATGRRNSTYLIGSNIENIVDPIAKQVLMNKQLPTDLQMIMKYMASKVIAGYVQDRNSLDGQRIRASEVLVHFALKQLLAAYTEYKEQILSGNTKATLRIIPTKLLQDFITSQIVVDMEYQNPMEEMSTMTRVNPVGKTIGGLPDRRAVQAAALNVHQSYFGNIDPLDTPEGEAIGVTQHLTIDAMITSARGLFQVKPVTDKENSGLLSTSTCMIPFIENNDGARILMAANQSRQSLPLKNPEPPIIQSGYESILPNVLSEVFVKRAPCSGKIQTVTSDRINIGCSKGGRQIVDVSPVHLRSGTGKDTLSIFKPLVKIGQVVKEDQVIAEGSGLSGGTLSLGRTLLTAIMPYKGYNFEDGIVISDKLVSDNKLTSLHGLTEDTLISKDDRLLFMVEAGINTVKGEPLLRRTIGEIEELLGYEEDEGESIIGGQYILKSPGGRVVEVEVFSNVGEDKFPRLKEYIQRTKRKYGVAPKEKFTIRGETIQGVFVRFKIEQELAINLGDKLCNRHGNKGIISLIEKDELMPRTPWGDRVEIILNPLGILGRMNIGQLYELYCGLISRELANRFVQLKSQTKVAALVKAVISKLDMTKNYQYTASLVNGIMRMPSSRFKQMMVQIANTKFVPIIIPPFKSPSYKEIDGALKLLGLKSGYRLSLPEFNIKTQSEVPVGYMYISKLEHLGDMKIHSRSTGPVKPTTLQPTAGKRREGGQRLGENETYSLISYNCPKLLGEFLGPLSDDHITKNEIIADIIQTGSAAYREAKVNPAGELLESYFVALMLAGR